MSRFLLDAASQGDVAKVRGYLDRGADVNWHKKEPGRTALSEAAINGHLEVARLLIERGADVNWTDIAMGFTPLAWACYGNHLPLVEYLLERGADPNLASPEVLCTPLMVASQNGNLPVVMRLLEAGANVNAATCDGRTALAIAQKHKRDEVVRALEAVGASAASPLPAAVRIPWPAVDESGATCDYSSPEHVLRSFVFAMNRFETQAAALYKASSTPGATMSAIKVLMQAVFDAYCTPIERPYGRQGSFAMPPEYDPDGENLTQLALKGPRRAELVTRDKREEYEFRYVLLKRGGRWLIDSKQRRLVGAKWNKAVL